MIHNFGFIALGVASASVNLSSPFFLGQAIDYYQKNHELPILYLLATCSAFILAPCIRFGAKIYLARSNASTRLELKQRSVNFLIQHDKESLSEGDIIEFIDNDIDGSIYLHHNIYYDISTSIAAILMAFITIFNYHYLLSIAPIAAIAFSSAIYILTRKILNNAYGKYIEENTALTSKILSATHTKTSRPFIEFETLKTSVLDTLWRTQLKISSLEAISGLSFLIGISLLLYIGSELLAINALTTGEFIASAMYVERILIPLGFLIGIYFSTAEALYRRSRVHALHGREKAHE